MDKIIERGADYVLGVKDNQPSLAEAITQWFSAAESGTMDRPFWEDIHVKKDHGRIETRRCLVTNDVAWLKEQNQHWCGLQSLIMIESTREVIGRNSTGHTAKSAAITLAASRPKLPCLEKQFVPTGELRIVYIGYWM